MTAPCTDTDVLGDVDMDRDPTCQACRGTRDGRVLECSNPAEWLAAIPCCKYSLLVCGWCKCFGVPWSCRKCGGDVTHAIGWVRL